MPEFKKVSELSGKDRAKVKDFWTPLFGAEYAKATTTDFKPQGETKEAKSKTEKKSA